MTAQLVSCACSAMLPCQIQYEDQCQNQYEDMYATAGEQTRHAAQYTTSSEIHF